MEKQKEDFRKLGARMAVAFTFVIALVMVLNGNLGNTIIPVDRDDLLADVGNDDAGVSDGDSVATWQSIGSYVKVGNQYFMKSKDGVLSPLGAEASEAGSGFLGIYFVNHSAGPANAYGRNTSVSFENWSKDNGFDYSHIDNFDLSFSTSNAFDIVVRCKFNRSEGPWNGTGWRNTWVRVNITLTGDVVINDVTGTWCESYNDSSSLSYYGNVYWNNGGAGYVLAAGNSADITEVSIEAKYSG